MTAAGDRNQTVRLSQIIDVLRKKGYQLVSVLTWVSRKTARQVDADAFPGRRFEARGDGFIFIAVSYGFASL